LTGTFNNVTRVPQVTSGGNVFGHRVAVIGAVAASIVATLAFATGAFAKAIRLPTLSKEIQEQRAIVAAHRNLSPPAPPCPESGLLQTLPLPVSLSNCGLPETPATTLPYPGPMAYWGGHVQVHPREYIVFWGWGEKGAFPGRTCASERVSEGAISATLACDPDGAGKYMANFVRQLGGTHWAGVTSQYYQSTGSGTQYISNDSNVLAGIWADDANNITGLPKTNGTNPAGPTNTYHDLAAEAQRAVAHFHIRNLIDSNIIIAQPPAYSDPNALSQGYCAFHDYTLTGSPGNYYYAGDQQGIAYTNMPYVNAINSGGQNDCGQYSVNGKPKGRLDAFSIALGHEIEETATDPGAEDILGNATTSHETYYGGWYDTIDANENGDKCAYVGTPINQVLGVPSVPGEPAVLPVPGAIGDIKGNAGETFAVQSTWSNSAGAGAGYCAGVNDLPGSLAGTFGSSHSSIAAGTDASTGKSKRAVRPRRHRRHRRHR
jgi:hypothetical protein